MTSIERRRRSSHHARCIHFNLSTTYTSRPRAIRNTRHFESPFAQPTKSHSVAPKARFQRLHFYISTSTFGAIENAHNKATTLRRNRTKLGAQHLCSRGVTNIKGRDNVKSITRQHIGTLDIGQVLLEIKKPDEINDTSLCTNT